MFGTYRAFKRRWELDTTYPLFTTKIQVWLAIFAFTSFIVSIFTPLVWRWFLMLPELSPVQWVFLPVSVFIILFFGVMGLYSLLKLVKLFWHGKFGQRIQIDSNMPTNVLEAITPITTEANIKECKAIISKLIKHRDELDRLISNYQVIIDKSEGQNGKLSNLQTL